MLSTFLAIVFLPLKSSLPWFSTTLLPKLPSLVVMMTWLVNASTLSSLSSQMSRKPTVLKRSCLCKFARSSVLSLLPSVSTSSVTTPRLALARSWDAFSERLSTVSTTSSATLPLLLILRKCLVGLTITKLHNLITSLNNHSNPCYFLFLYSIIPALITKVHGWA